MELPRIIDGVDTAILAMLQKNGRMPNVEIARRIKMAPSAVLERIRKLEDRGVIRGYTTRLNSYAVQCGLLAFVFVRTKTGAWRGDTDLRLAELPEVQEVHHVAGEDCFLVKVRVKDTAALGSLIRDRISGLEAVASTRTTIVLDTVKETTDLPLKDEGCKGIAGVKGEQR